MPFLIMPALRQRGPAEGITCLTLFGPLGSLDPWSMRQKPVRKAVFWQLAGKRMLHDAAAVHYTARAEQQATETSLGLNHGTVVPLGVDTLIEDPAKDSQSLGSEIAESEGPSLRSRPFAASSKERAGGFAGCIPLPDKEERI